MKKTILLSVSAFMLIFLTQCSTYQRVYTGHCKGLSKEMMWAKHKSLVRYH